MTRADLEQLAQLVADELERRGLVASHRRAKPTPGVLLSDVERLRRLGMRPRKVGAR